MNTKYVPAIVMLTAGLIDCIVAIVQHTELFAFTKQLLLVLLVFLFLGCVVKLVIDKAFRVDKEEEEREESETEEKEAEQNGEEVRPTEDETE